MVKLSERFRELRFQKGVSRTEMAAQLGLPAAAIDRFETGRATPNREQMKQLAGYFGVSELYLRGETDDPTSMETWINRAFLEEEEPVRTVKAPKERPAPSAPGDQSSLADAFLHNKAFQEMVRSTVLEVLRSPEGQQMLERTVRRELDRQR